MTMTKTGLKTKMLGYSLPTWAPKQIKSALTDAQVRQDSIAITKKTA